MISSSPTQPVTVGKLREHYQTFDLLRILAALAVIVSHSYPLTGADGPVLIADGKFEMDLGAFAVGLFFVCSGFLITQSWMSRPYTGSYLLRRFVRIWPGFAVAVVLAAFVVGPGATLLTVSVYFGAKETWSYLGHTLFMAPVKFRLPGVFANNSMPVVNISLWTLPYEVLCYLGVLALGLVRGLRCRWFPLAILGFSLLVMRLAVVEGSIDIGRLYGLGLTLRQGLPLLCWFLAGVCVFLFPVQPHRRLSAVALAAALILVGAVVGEVVIVIPGVAYLIIFVGRLPFHPAVLLRRLGDPSYGIYLYGFLIQQCLVSVGMSGPTSLTMVAAPLACILGYLSWHLVESPALRVARIKEANRRVQPVVPERQA